MSSQGTGEDGDHERQRAPRSRPGTHESVDDTRHQLQIQSVQIPTTPRGEAHAMLAYTLPVGQETATPVTDAQTGAVQPIYTHANLSEGDRFSQSSTLTSDMAMTAENKSTVGLHPSASFVQQENDPPIASSKMSNQGCDKEGDQEHERALNSQSGIHESTVDTRDQLPIEGVQIETIPRAEVHAMPVGQGTAFSISDTQTGAIPPINTLANMSEENRFSQSSASVPDTPLIAGNNSTLVVQPPAASVQQETYPPTAVVQPQPHYSLSDICRQHIPAEDPIAPPRQMMDQAPQSTVENTPTTFAHMEDGPRMTNILRQANYSAEVSSVGQSCPLCAQELSGEPTGAQGRETTQVLEHPVHVVAPSRVGVQQKAVPLLPTPPVRTPSSVNMERQVAASTTKHVVHTSTTQSNVPTESQIPLTPAIETESIQRYEPETNTPEFSPVQQQQTGGYEMQQTSNSAIEDDMTLNADHNTNEEGERIYRQDSAVFTSHQMIHKTTSKNQHVTQVPKVGHPDSNVADRHQVNYPTCTSVPPQQLKMMQEAGSTSEFINPSRTDTQDKSIQVNIGLQQQESVPIHNPSNTERPNTPSYNSPATSSQVSPLLTDTPDLMQEESDSSLDERRMTQSRESFQPLDVDPEKLNVILSHQVPRDNTEMRQLQRVLDSRDRLLRREERGQSNREYILHPEDRAETGAGDIPVLPTASAVPERECDAQNVTVQQQSAHSSTSGPQMCRVRPNVRAYIFIDDTDCFVCREEAYRRIQQQNPGHETNSSRSSETTNMNREGSFLRGVASDTLPEKNKSPRGISSQPPVPQAGGSPAEMDGENRSTGGSPVPGEIRASLQSGANSEVTSSCVTETVSESTPEAVDQRQVTEARAGRKKRYCDINEYSTTTAKRQATSRLGTELQLETTTSVPQQIDSNTSLSAIQDTADDTLGSAALSVTTEENEKILESDYLNSCMKLNETETQTVEGGDDGEYDDGLNATDVPRQQQIVEQQEDDFLPDAPQAGVMQERQNATAQWPSEMMAISQQLPKGTIAYKGTQDNVDDFTSESEEMFASRADKDCCTELNKTETRTADDGDKGECDDGVNNTAFPRQEQMVEDQETDDLSDAPQSDEEGTISDDQEDESDTIMILFYL